MRRLFYFTGYRLSVLHWKGKQLVGSSSFEPTESGLDKFRHYLIETKNIPGKFLVDVIEEDFRMEKIPHVGSKDRASVINRLEDRHYRSSQDYCYNEIIGREKTDRKDDIVLLGAMTNPQLIQPWITTLDECKVPLSGIWTLPLISKKLLKTIKATSGVVLLVSQQVSSNVRQTLFRDCKLISSRQSIINQSMTDISGIGELAAPEVNRTIEFLRAQNLVASTEIIDLHILGSDEQLVSLEQAFKPDEYLTVTIHPIAEIKDKLSLSGIGSQFSDGIFAWLCLDQTFLGSHYGKRHLFNRYYNKLAATALYATSLLVVIASVLMTEANISVAMESEKSIVLSKQAEKNYKDLYSKRFKDFEGVFENAGVMSSAVELAERIKINSATSPLDFMIALSNVLSKENIGTVYIDKIEWKAVNIDERTKQLKKANFTGKLAVKHDAVITGRIVESEDDYRASMDQMNTIIDYLRADSRIEKVEALIMPVDLRSESKFSTESGVDVKHQKKGNESIGIFSLKILMKEPDHA